MHAIIIMVHKSGRLFLGLGFLFMLLTLPFSAQAKDYLYVTNIDANLFSVIDTDTGLVVKEVPVGVEPCDVAIDPEGKWVAISHEKHRGDIYLFNRKTLTVEHKVLLVEKMERKVDGFFLVFSSDGLRLYAVNQFSGFLYVLDPTAGKIVNKVMLGKVGQIRGISLSPDGKSLYIPDLTDNKIIVVDTTLESVKDTIKLEGGASGIAVSPDGKTIYVTNEGNLSLDVLDIKTKRVRKRIPIGTSPAGVAISRDGTVLFVSNMLSYSVTKIDTGSEEPVANIPVGSYPVGIVVSPDGKRVYVCNYNENNISIIDTTSNREVARVATMRTPFKIAVYSAP